MKLPAAFSEQRGALYLEDASLQNIAEQFGTPCFVYARAAIEQKWRALDAAFGGHPHLVCYAVKANDNLAVLDILARLGSGFDIVSGGELARVRAAGGEISKVIFSGVGKSETELQAAVAADLFSINVESLAELQLLQNIAAAQDARPRVAMRINPDVHVDTHRYITTGQQHNKFGIAMEQASDACRCAATMPNINLHGLACHIGSQWTDTDAVADAAKRTVQLATQLRDEGIDISHVDLGGGLGVCYRDEKPPSADEYVQTLLAAVNNSQSAPVQSPSLSTDSSLSSQSTKPCISIALGRAIVAAAGVLLTRVEYLKHSGAHHFAVVDAAMNDLLRPALYDAWHDIRPINNVASAAAVRQRYDIVGPVCESADFLGLQRDLTLSRGDYLAVMNCGAYSAVMASNYNSRPRPPEVIVDGAHVHLCRPRQSVASLFANECTLPR